MKKMKSSAVSSVCRLLKPHCVLLPPLNENRMRFALRSVHLSYITNVTLFIQYLGRNHVRVFMTEVSEQQSHTPKNIAMYSYGALEILCGKKKYQLIFSKQTNSSS